MERHREIRCRRGSAIGDIRLALHRVAQARDLFSHAWAFAKLAIRASLSVGVARVAGRGASGHQPRLPLESLSAGRLSMSLVDSRTGAERP